MSAAMLGERGSAYRMQRRTARKPHHCSSCGNGIERGEAYIRHVEFPGGDAGYADHAGHPVSMAECSRCATRYGRGDVLHPSAGAGTETTDPNGETA